MGPFGPIPDTPPSPPTGVSNRAEAGSSVRVCLLGRAPERELFPDVVAQYRVLLSVTISGTDGTKGGQLHPPLPRSNTIASPRGVLVSLIPVAVPTQGASSAIDQRRKLWLLAMGVRTPVSTPTSGILAEKSGPACVTKAGNPPFCWSGGGGWFGKSQPERTQVTYHVPRISAKPGAGVCGTGVGVGGAIGPVTVLLLLQPTANPTMKAARTADVRCAVIALFIDAPRRTLSQVVCLRWSVR